MPWVDDVDAIMQAWYSGNEAGNALSDVIFGTVNPSGRLPLTLPVREQDIPAYLNTHSENGKIHYREDLFVGYKWYQARGLKTLFPFGHGLSYTTFALSDLAISPVPSSNSLFAIDVSVLVTNEGTVAGSEAVQLYITLPTIGLTTPKLQLRGFGKAKDLAPGASTTVKISLDKYAVSFWDAVNNVWSVRAGVYGVSIGKSSENIVLHGEFDLQRSFDWSGL
ncbi:hypothetical protein PHLCEN_2v9300 [Hermanssonia centrifuga]|uniref:beta-glucosidase n=1 Tax=Hermanssonia centrifuga TaxID=98765 RepID=A0A2R6NRX0_9APHY|nr:hypothetical protein PHLCEN_2v9300 [Hermanssonia centrifuga]